MGGRPHPRLGTVELRVCDAVTRVEDAVALSALLQSLVKQLCEQVESGRGVVSAHRVLSTENKWLAARHGLDAEVIDLARERTARIPLRALIARTLGEVAPHAPSSAANGSSEGISEILAGGTSAERQAAPLRAGR